MLVGIKQLLKIFYNNCYKKKTFLNLYNLNIKTQKKAF